MPLKKLINYTGNIYQLVSAAIKRAQQITDIRAAYNPTTLEEGLETPIKPKNEFGDEKATCIAFREIFNDEVSYKLKED